MEELVSELRESMEWSDTALAVLKHVWKEEGPALCALPTHTLTVGQVHTHSHTHAHTHTHTEEVRHVYQSIHSNATVFVFFVTSF